MSGRIDAGTGVNDFYAGLQKNGTSGDTLQEDDLATWTAGDIRQGFNLSYYINESSNTTLNPIIFSDAAGSMLYYKVSIIRMGDAV